MRTLMTSCFISTFLALTCFGGQAGAQSNDENDDNKAKEAFKNGKDLFEAGNFTAAAVQFRIAYKHKPTWKLLYNIGQCETGAKRYGLALEAFEQYLVESGDDIAIGRRDEIRSETTRLREMVGSVKITGPSGAEVFVDGVKRGELPLSGYVPVTAAVEHTVSGIVNGQKLSVVVVKVMTAQVFDVELKIDPTATEEAAPEHPGPEEGPDEANGNGETDASVVDASEGTTQAVDSNQPPPHRSTSEDSGAQKLRILGLSTLGVGGAVLGVSIFTGIAAMKKNGELDDLCLDGIKPCTVEDTDENTELRDKRDVLGGVTTGLWIGGGILATTGVVLLILSKRKREQMAESVNFKPMVTHRGISGSLMWRF